MDSITGISLFSGIGGLELGIKMVVPNFRTVCYVENDRYCQAVLMSRMQDKELDTAPIWDDVKTFDGKPWCGRVDIVFGGFPCQDLSVAGKQAGLVEGKRSQLWFEFVRIVEESCPKYVFIENVWRLILDRKNSYPFLASLAKIGYDAKWTIIPASAVGAPFKGDRVFVLAEASGQHSKKPILGDRPQEAGNEEEIRRCCNDVGTSKCVGLRWKSWWRTGEEFANGCVRNETFWRDGRVHRRRLIKPGICVLADGVQRRMEQIKSYGNAVVPHQVAKALQILLNYE